MTDVIADHCVLAVKVVIASRETAAVAIMLGVLALVIANAIHLFSVRFQDAHS